MMLLLINWCSEHCQFIIGLNICCDTVEADNEGSSFESKAGKETIDFKEVKRIDHILASLHRKVTWLTKFFPCFYIADSCTQEVDQRNDTVKRILMLWDQP